MLTLFRELLPGIRHPMLRFMAALCAVCLVAGAPALAQEDDQATPLIPPTAPPPTASDPYPEPLPRTASLTVEIAEFATLPDSDGQPPLMKRLTHEPGTGRLFVNDMRGILYAVSLDGRSVAPYVDLREPRWDLDLFVKGTRGLRSFAFHPEFNTPGRPGYGKFYTLSDTDNLASGMDFPPKKKDDPHGAVSVLMEWSAKDPAAARYDGGAPRVLMRYMLSDGMLAFNPLVEPGDPDYGHLYMTVSERHNRAQGPFWIHGKMLRIDPLGSNSTNRQYGYPNGNPFADDNRPGTLGEIYAYGFRNPQRFAWDTATGNLFVADIGHKHIEEINIVTKGGNYGWKKWEGSFRTANGAKDILLDDPRSDSAITYPVVEYDHTDELLHRWVAVTGLVIYRHHAIPQLDGLMLFGDIPSGEVFYVRVDDLPANGGPEAIRRILFDHQGRTTTFLDLIREKKEERGEKPPTRADLRFGTGPDGMVFLLNKQDGVIRRLFHTSQAVKALKDTGLDQSQAEAITAAVDRAVAAVDKAVAPVDHAVAGVREELALVKWVLGANLALSLVLLPCVLYAVLRRRR